MSKNISPEKAIESLVKTAVESYAEGFKGRHLGEFKDPSGTINMKIHNIFISALGPDIQYYTALVRSLNSSLGNMLEKLAINIAGLFYEVKRRVEGPLTVNQTRFIAELLEKYKSRVKKPEVKDYQPLRDRPKEEVLTKKRHDSDYFLIDKKTKEHYTLLSLK